MTPKVVRDLSSNFRKIHTLSGQLSWIPYCEIIKWDNDLEISSYSQPCDKANWSARGLKQQIKSMPQMAEYDIKNIRNPLFVSKYQS